MTRWTILTHAADKLTRTSVAVHVVCERDVEGPEAVRARCRDTFTMVFATHPSGTLRLGSAACYHHGAGRELLARSDLPAHILDLGETRALAALG